jgi:small-conductance mechanosensitive channel
MARAPDPRRLGGRRGVTPHTTRGRARPAQRPGVRPGSRRSRQYGTGTLATGARSRLRGFRQVTILAVAATAFFLLLFAPGDTNGAEQTVPGDSPAAAPAAVPDTVSVIEPVAVEDLVEERAAAEDLSPDTVGRAAAEEATGALRDLWIGFVNNLPKYAIALGVLLLAWGVVRLLRPALRRVLRGWERSNALVVLVGFAIWLIAFGIALSVLVGDIRALVGSLGLVGLALSWALQTPIESFTGWLMNSFQGYYRVGDRVAVGEVFGDVYRIDVLTTTVWEIGGADQNAAVRAEQPTGRLITFPNYEVLRGSIVNVTRDFPYVWDELDLQVGNRSDLTYAVGVLQRLAERTIGEEMLGPARMYEEILRDARLETSVADAPQVFVSLDDSWTTLTIRYLVGARERRRWKSILAKAAMEELNRPEHAERIRSVFPRRQIQFVGADGRATDPGWVTEAPAAEDGRDG